jgi:hypothetical protein
VPDPADHDRLSRGQFGAEPAGHDQGCVTPAKFAGAQFGQPAAMPLVTRDIRPYVSVAVFSLSIFCFLAASGLDLD